MNPDANAELLAQLRDIHGAPPAPFWPPAPGWWILAALVLLLAAWVGWKLWRAWRVKQRRRSLLTHLHALRSTCDPASAPQSYLSSVNRLLKVAAMRAFPAEAPGSLQGEDWVAFLSAKQDHGGALEALATGPYQPQPEFDPAALESAAGDWLLRHG